MEMIKIKHREFEIIETLSDNCFIATRKNNKFFVRKFTPKSEEGNEIAYAVRKIYLSGVKSPKLFYLDEKLGYVVSEYLEGELMSEYLSKNDMTEEMYRQLFYNAYSAKINHMTLDYSPNNWMVVLGDLYYIKPLFIIYQKEKDLVDKYLRLWFNTKELAEFLSKNNVFYDKSRIKDEYSTNKHIVLMTCKYYR